MVWDNRKDDWGRNAANMIGRPGFRIEIPLMFREERGSDLYQPMSRNGMKRIANELRRMANEIDHCCAASVETSGWLYPIGSALYQIKGHADSVNRGIQAILKAEKQAVEGDRKVVNLHE